MMGYTDGVFEGWLLANPYLHQASSLDVNKCDRKNSFKNQVIFRFWLICYIFFPRYLLV